MVCFSPPSKNAELGNRNFGVGTREPLAHSLLRIHRQQHTRSARIPGLLGLLSAVTLRRGSECVDQRKGKKVTTQQRTNTSVSRARGRLPGKDIKSLLGKHAFKSAALTTL